MARSVRQLALLNQADLALDAARTRLAQIAAALHEPAALTAARANYAAAEAELARCQTEQHKLEQAQAEAAARVARTEQKLYSGRINNPRELEDAERDLQQQRNQQATIEDRLLDTLVAVEGATTQHDVCQVELSRLAAEWEQTQATLRKEQAQLKTRLPALQAQQAASRQAASQALLPLYDSLRSRKGGRAVAELDGEICSACCVAVSPSKFAAVLDSDELIYCGNCGRLVWAE